MWLYIASTLSVAIDDCMFTTSVAIDDVMYTVYVAIYF